METNLKKDRSFIGRLLNVDRKILYIVFVIAVGFPMIYPVGLPLGVNYKVIDCYDQITSVPEGGNVLFCLSMFSGNYPEIEGGMVAMTRHLFSLPVNIYFISFVSPVSVTILHELVMPQVDTQGKIYGEDWVNFGYYVGLDTAQVSFVNDMKGLVKEDYLGNDVSGFEIMENVDTAMDFDLIISVGSSDWNNIIKNIVARTEDPYLIGQVAVNTPQMMAFYGAEISGILDGMRGGAEYELYSGFKGVGLSQMDSQSTGHLVVIAAILIGNIGYSYQRYGRKQE